MKISSACKLVVSGIGVTSAIGQGKTEFMNGLLTGRNCFGRMQRPGRTATTAAGEIAFIGAEIDALVLPARFSARTLRNASLSAQMAAATLDEAWHDARLDAVDGERIGMIVGGSNVQQRELLQLQNAYCDRVAYLRPSYALTFLDSDVCGLCSELFGIRGMSATLGAASASGQMAVIQAALAVMSGQVDVCVAVGALMDVSFWECQAFRSAGAMVSDAFAEDPAAACRPFDKRREGFVYGESCAALIVEYADTAAERGIAGYSEIAGWGVVNDAVRGTDPSCDGEVRAIQRALEQARISAAEIDYVNPHGSGSIVGDETEIRAIRASGLAHARINATKAFTGHGLSAAGAVELVATLLQMRSSQLHPTRNLDEPIDPDLNWVGSSPVPHVMRHGLSLSMGFGGINTAVCLRTLELN
jgi:malonyl-ACP decarboxylase